MTNTIRRFFRETSLLIGFYYLRYYIKSGVKRWKNNLIFNINKQRLKTKNNFYILTGGPCSGKTSLIDTIHKMGYHCVPEVGRKIIKGQVIIGGDALPWADTGKYSNLMLSHSIQDYMQLFDSPELHFFDRGIPDTLGYVELINMLNKQKFIDAVEEYRYNPTVFILPPWEEIYKTDNERKQDFQLAVATYEAMKSVYQKAGYDLIELPLTTISQRIDFILGKIGNEH